MGQNHVLLLTKSSSDDKVHEVYRSLREKNSRHSVFGSYLLYATLIIWNI